MKAGRQLFVSMLLGMCASIGCAGLLQAQIGETNVTWQGTVDVVTVSNVTYAKYTWMLYGCDCESVFSTGPLIQNGSNFKFDFDLQDETGPVACPQFIARVTTTADLGLLAPGDYTLITTSWGTPVGTNAFTIPIISKPPPTPVLCPSGFAPTVVSKYRCPTVTVTRVTFCNARQISWRGRCYRQIQAGRP